MPVKKLLFITDYDVKDEAGTVFKAGDTLEVDNDASFDRWIRRGVAVDANDKDAQDRPKQENEESGDKPSKKKVFSKKKSKG